MLDLRDQDKELLCQLATDCFSTPVEIWAYGSRVHGTNHEASDLDLVIRREGLEAVEISELVEFKEKIQDSNVPILVQVFDWKRLPESFHANILQKYEVLFSSIQT